MGGRVKDPAAKQAIAKNIGDISEPVLMDLESGAFKAKKQKKEKTANEIAVADLKAFEKKTLNCTRMYGPLYVPVIRLLGMTGIDIYIFSYYLPMWWSHS